MNISPTGGDTRSLSWRLGEKDATALIAEAGNGIYIDRFWAATATRQRAAQLWLRGPYHSQRSPRRVIHRGELIRTFG